MPGRPPDVAAPIHVPDLGYDQKEDELGNSEPLNRFLSDHELLYSKEMSTVSYSRYSDYEVWEE